MGVTTPAATQSTSVWLFICDLQDADGPGGGGGGGCGGRGPGGCCCDSRRSLLVLSRRDADKGGGDEAVETLLRVACISTVLLNSPNERCENLLPEALRSSSVHEMCRRGKVWKRSIATVPDMRAAPHRGQGSSSCMHAPQSACMLAPERAPRVHVDAVHLRHAGPEVGQGIVLHQQYHETESSSSSSAQCQSWHYQSKHQETGS